jgi:hypothetical protein
VQCAIFVRHICAIYARRQHTWSLGALNKRADIDPECYVVRDGKLYLFYRDPALDTRELWLKDSESLLQKAKANWPKLSK